MQWLLHAILAWYAGFALNWLVLGAQHLPTAFLYSFAATVFTALLLVSWELHQQRCQLLQDHGNILFPLKQLEVYYECHPNDDAWKRFQNFLKGFKKTTPEKPQHLIMSMPPIERHMMAEKLLENVGTEPEKTLAISACVLLEEPELLGTICRKSVEANKNFQHMMIYDLSVLAPMPPLTESSLLAQRQKVSEQRKTLLNIRSEPEPQSVPIGVDDTPISMNESIGDQIDSSIGAIALASFQAEKVLQMLITVEEILWKNPRLNTIWLLSDGSDDPVRERIWIESITSLLRQNMPGSSVTPIRRARTAHVI